LTASDFGAGFTLANGDAFGLALVLRPTPLQSQFNLRSVLANDIERLVFSDAVTFEPVSQVPLPATLPLFATGLGALGLLSWRRKRKLAFANAP
jgi:hypothetical protein